jgi:hypothetical protein
MREKGQGGELGSGVQPACPNRSLAIFCHQRPYHPFVAQVSK